MDATIIAALIGALATIIAALIAALIAQRSGAARDREQMATMIDAATIIAQRLATTREAEERAFLEENLETLRQVDPRQHAPKPETVSLVTAESQFLLVVQYQNPRPAFNILMTILNNGDQVAVVDGMEAVVTGPDGRQQRFNWHLFYGIQRGGTLHTVASYVHPVAVPPGEMRSLGIQFIGPDHGLDRLYNWEPGRYDVDVYAWVNRHRDDRPTNVKTRFSFDLIRAEIGQLKRWISWDADDWARFPHPDFPDPHQAAGLPVNFNKE